MAFSSEIQGCLIFKSQSILYHTWYTEYPCPNPRICEYAALYSKRDFADVIKLRILRWENYSELCSCIQCNRKGPYT